MVMMGDKAFVDTNILLRALLRQMPFHIAAEVLVQQMWANNVVLWVSRQVIREFLVQATHPKTMLPAPTLDEVLEKMQMVRSLFKVTDEDERVTDNLLMLIETYRVQGKQIHDTNIVAVMLTYGIDTLITLNIEDFRRYTDRIKIITLQTNP